MLTDDDIFICENGSPEDLKVYIAALRANHDQIEADYLRLYAAHKALRAELAAVRQMWKETIDRRIRQALKNG